MVISEQVHRVCQLAADEARALGAAQVGTEHVLLALLGVEGVASAFLGQYGVELSRVRRAVAERFPSADVPEGTPALSLPAEWLFGAVFWKAVRSGSGSLDTQHVLLGLLRQPESVAGEVLRDLGLVPGILAEQLRDRPDPTAFPRPEPRASSTARFGGASLRVLRQAEEEGLRRRQQYVGTEHILLSLFHEGACRGRQVLAQLGVEPERVRRDVERMIRPCPDAPARGPLPFTPRARYALQCSREEADSSGHQRVSTDHLLLGLYREEESIAGQVLRRHGLRLDTIRAEVGNLRASGTPGPDDD